MKRGKEPTTYFYLETKPSKKTNRHRIYFEMRYGASTGEKGAKKYLPIKISTGWAIEKDAWDTEWQQPKKNYSTVRKSEILSAMDEVKSEAINQLKYMREQNRANGLGAIEPNHKDLKKRIMNRLNGEQSDDGLLLKDHTAKMIRTRPLVAKGSPTYWSDKTVEQYEDFVNHIANYENKIGKALVLGELDVDTYWHFFTTISEMQKDETGQYYAQDTISKICNRFRAVLKDAFDEGLPIGFNFQKKGLKIKGFKPQEQQVYLKKHHLKAVIEADVTHSKELTHGRNYIILSSFTSLRIGDMTKMKDYVPDIKVKDGYEYHFVRNKIIKSKSVTGGKLEAVEPLLRPVRDLLEENGGEFPTFPSQTNTRRYVKKLLDYVGVHDEVIVEKMYYPESEIVETTHRLCDVFKAHSCRDTFITHIEQLGVKNAEVFTHPKSKASTAYQGYNRTTKEEAVIMFIDDLNSKGDDLFYH